MYPLRNESDLIELLDSISSSAVNQEKLDFLVKNAQTVGNLGSSQVRVAFWKAAKQDGTSTLRVLGAALGFLPSFPWLPINRMLSIMYKTDSTMMLEGLKKVIIFLLLMVNMADAFQMRNDGSNIIVTSSVKKSELVGITETFMWTPLNLFRNELLTAINKTKRLNEYRLSAKSCEDVEVADDLYNVSRVIKEQNFFKVRLNSLEQFDRKDYDVAMLIDQKGFTRCIIDFSNEFQKKLMAANLFRRSIVNDKEASNYFTFLNGYFENMLKQPCIKHGMLYYKDQYRVSFDVDSPGIERCAAICKSHSDRYLLSQTTKSVPNACITQNVRNNFSCIDYGFIDHPCKLWSFDIQSNRCYFLNEMKDDTLLNLYKFYDFRATMSGSTDCQPKLSQNQVQIKVNDKLSNAKNLCLFSAERFDDMTMQTKCPAKYAEIIKPLNQLFQQLIYFRSNFAGLYNTRPKRAVASVVFLILKEIASQLGPHIVRSLVNGVGLSPKKMLSKTKTKLIESGFKSTYVNGPLNFKDVKFNFTSLALHFDRLNDMTLTGETLQIKKEIEALSLSFFNLKTYFLSLMTDSSPMTDRTKNFIGDKSFVFSAYLYGEQIFRHFFISRSQNSKAAKTVTIIPKNLANFNNLAHYQTGSFSENLSSVCIMRILQGMEISALIKSSICKHTNSVTAVTKDIIVVAHRAEDEVIKLISIRGSSFVEVYCQNNTFIWQSKQLFIFAVGNGCSVLIDKVSIKADGQGPSAFLAKILYEDGAVNGWFFFGQDWVWFLFGLLLLALSSLTVAWVVVKMYKPQRHYDIKIDEIKKDDVECEPMILKRIES